MKLHSNPTPSRRGFTLVELLVVIIIVAVLSLVGFMVGTRALDSTRRATSLGNLRQFGVAFQLFAVDNNGYLPLSRYNGAYWPETLFPYLPKEELYLRAGSVNQPLDASTPNGYFPGLVAKTPEGNDIRWNITINGGHTGLPFAESDENPGFARGYSRRMTSLQEPERLIFLADGTSWWLNAEAKKGSPRLYRWKNGTTNILFGDGTVKNLNPDTQLSDDDFLVKRKN